MSKFSRILTSGALALGLATGAAQAATWSVVPTSTESFEIRFQWDTTPVGIVTTDIPVGFDYDLSLVSYSGTGSDQTGYFFDVDGVRLTNSNTTACNTSTAASVGISGNCDLIAASTAPGVLFAGLSAGSTFQLGIFDSATPTFGALTFSASKVAPIPLPAAGILLLGALGGIAALRRRKKAD